MVLSPFPSLNFSHSDLFPDRDVSALQERMNVASLEFCISTDSVDLPLGSPPVSTTVDGGMNLPLMVATPTDTTIDGGLKIETQHGKSEVQLDCGQEFGCIESFANAATASDLLETLIDQELPSFGLRPRSTINAPLRFRSFQVRDLNQV